MSGSVVVFLLVGMPVSIWLFWGLARWRWTACKCAREVLPWFATRHEREWVMLAETAGFAYSAVVAAFLGWTFGTVYMGLYGVWSARVIYEHRKGKRSVLGRLWGRVTFNQHGRLTVVQK